jgi:phytoene desaturase
VLERLSALGFDDLDKASFTQSWTPDDLGKRYNLAAGSAFGLSHNFWQVGYMRPANKSSAIPNVYFVGASTAPGGGVPMVIIGSRLTTERIMTDRADA